MKESARLEQILEQFKLTSPLSYFVKRKIFKSKRRIFAKIIKLERYDSIFVSAAVYFEYMLNRLGISTTLAGGARAFATAAVFSLFVILSSMLAVVYNYDRISQTFIAKTEVQEYQKGFILIADSSVKIIRDNKEMPEIKSKDRLFTKDEIITDENGKMLFQLEKKTSVAVMAKSRVAVDVDLKTKALSLHHGTVLCNVREMPADESFKVTTQNAMVVVVGTQFSVSYNGQSTAVTVLKGAVRAINLKSNEESRVNEGKTAVIYEDKIELKDSGKAEIMMLQRFGKLEYMNNIMDKSDMEMNELRESVLKLDKETEEEKEEKEQKGKEKKILTLEDIKEKYGKLEEIQLYNGKRYTGAIISRTGTFSIVTVKGIKKITAKDVKNVRIIK